MTPHDRHLALYRRVAALLLPLPQDAPWWLHSQRQVWLAGAWVAIGVALDSELDP